MSSQRQALANAGGVAYSARAQAVSALLPPVQCARAHVPVVQAVLGDDVCELEALQASLEPCSARDGVDVDVLQRAHVDRQASRIKRDASLRLS